LDDVQAREIPGVVAGRYVLLAVRDTGIGITKEVRPHLFEPFFTTKPPGQGTGLGLSTVFGILTQSGGHLTVDSTPGRGAAFNAFFPRVDQAAAEEPAPSPPPPSTTGGTETVLLVEDEEVVRRLARNVLASKGYTVLEASSGEAAISLGESHPARIDLVITDVVMPGMTGRELADRLNARLPGARLLYISGYAEEDVLGQDELESGLPFLSKPFSPDQLLRKVREALDRRA
jgi:CheY-like chemotaxis protein